jgi:hypothetical protein
MKTEEHRLTLEEQSGALKCIARYLTMPVKHDLDSEEKAALDRLIRAALRGTGQSRIVANFLLAWWNSTECGAFNPIQLWGLDRELADDVCLIFRAIASMAKYPDALGYEKRFDQIVRLWRPQLFANDNSDRKRPG